MRLSPRAGVFTVLMLALTALFAGLGTWQLDRLAWKNNLTEAAQERVGLDPVPLPPAGQWFSLAPDDYGFTVVTLTGHYASDPPVLVFTSLSPPRGEYGGPGYWVMHLFEVAGGGRVWVNRGFVPQDRSGAFDAPPEGALTLTGLMRRPELAGPFTPRPEIDNRRDYVRNPKRFPAPADIDRPVVAPFTVDLTHAATGLPQAGETVIDFSNRHFEYALTWYALAVLTPLLLGIWLWRDRQNRAPLAPSEGDD